MTDVSEKPEGGGKGRPTPKRGEAQRKARQPFAPGRRTRAGSAAGRTKAPSRAGSMREAMRTGDERNYPPAAAGPERAVVRDAVDGRKAWGRLAIPGWAAVMVLTLLPSVATRTAASLLMPAVLGVVVGDSWAAARTVRRALAAQFPQGTKDSRRSLAWYGIARNSQFRRSRLPRPRVTP